MKLERIIMSGFKSFANKTIVELTDGVTAVVGPNGSGKSNLAEAIKWVLGEQSAKSLRGKRMDDLIFSGSDSKKAVNFCEVSLVFNNEDRHLAIDANEVVITRRYHRTGESQVYINQQAVRLKDVTLLLMDSGMGKDSFSMISQGKVEEIFNNRPEQRRDIIEEVAGVLTYKNQKAEAERKLTRTEDHLSRLKDILFEISGQLEPLERQSQKAIQYKELDKELRDLSIRLLASELKRIKGQQESLNKEQDLRRSTYQELQRAHETKSQSLSLANADLEERHDRINSLKRSYVQFVEKKTKQAGEYDLLTERLKHAESSGADQRKQLQKVQLNIKNLVQEKNSLEESHSLHQAKAKLLQKEGQDLAKDLHNFSQGQEEELNRLKNDYFDLLQEKARLEQAVRQFEDGKEQRETTLKRKEQELKELEAQLKRIKDKQVTSQEALKVKEADLKDLEDLIKDQKAKHETLQDKYQKIDEAFQKADRELNGLKTRYDSLSAMAKEHAGYYGGVKYLLQHKTEIPGLIGAVAELIRLKPEHELAISTALGASAQHLVTETERAAKLGIKRLKTDGKGRATFLPLPNLSERSLAYGQVEAAKQVDGFIGVAIDLVTCEQKIKKAVSQSLANVIVARDLDSASSISASLHRKVRVVTLEGDVFNAGGSLSGGQQQAKGANLISRQSELEQLHERIGRMEKDVKDLADKKAKWAKEVDEIRSLASNDLKRSQAIQLELSRLTADLDYQTDSLREQEKQLQVRRYEWQMAQEDESADQSRYVEKGRNLEHVIEKIRANKERMKVLEISDEERQDQIKILEEALKSNQTDYAVVMEQLKHEKKQLADKKEALENEQVLEKELLQGESLSKEEEAKLKSRQEELKVLLKQSDLDRDSYEKDMAKEELAYEKAQKQLAALSKAERQLYQEMEAVQLEIAEKEKEEARYDLQMDQMLTQLTEEFRMSFEKAVQYGELEIAIPEAKRLVKSLRSRIQQLGPINMESIDEYELTKNRFDDLTQQKQDVEEAKSDLEATMKELDQEVRERFKDTFFKVKDAFEATFPRLFGGGRASLELTEPGDYLTTGVDIIAQPPGKKLQSLSLLSGGERALTAIALLFAILQVKPVPFCLLDEVEAALDDANVSRYGHYLKSFTPATQFMVITHRKGTMEEADVLYGVTMQDSGVSAIASVKLEDVNEADLTA